MTDLKPTTAQPATSQVVTERKDFLDQSMMAEARPGLKGDVAIPGEKNAAGTVASDGEDVKTYPPHFVREKVHIGNGNFKWSEPFDPADRAREESEAAAERLKQRGSFPEPEPYEENPETKS